MANYTAPSSACEDADGYVYVADWGNHRVQVFDPDGGFLQSLRGQATVSKWAQDFLDTNLEEAAARSKIEPRSGPRTSLKMTLMSSLLTSRSISGARQRSS